MNYDYFLRMPLLSGFRDTCLFNLRAGLLEHTAREGAFEGCLETSVGAEHDYLLISKCELKGTHYTSAERTTLGLHFFLNEVLVLIFKAPNSLLPGCFQRGKAFFPKLHTPSCA